ncbi:MAG: 2-C-methyl-D-erythritol 4-phosphate cytidylyltransferase [Moraxellaceae bacterium]|nr:2-C-methyl-D-erythritol 4-phosphate cytidylyltransferase [Moraxellaceae bacterium]
MTTTKINIHGLVVCAGSGSRFGSDIPKQYTRVANKTIAQYSIDRLAESAYIDNCHLVIAKDDTIAKTLSWAMPIKFAIGGAERWQSVEAGVQSIADTGATEQDLVVIHDSARPCVQATDIDKVIEVAFNEKFGAILATPVADTLKQVTDNNEIIKTIDRQHLWQAQTPQVFRFGALQQVLQVVRQQNLMITDEASGFEHLGYPIRVVLGSRNNIKITYPEDLAWLNFHLNNQS